MTALERAPEPEPPRRPRLGLAWKIASITFGVSLVLLGIAGLFLPILQGWLMIFGGLAVLSPYSRRARWILKTLKQKLGIEKKTEGGDKAADEGSGDSMPGRDRRTGS